jgi:hypothetical protein
MTTELEKDVADFLGEGTPAVKVEETPKEEETQLDQKEQERETSDLDAEEPEELAEDAEGEAEEEETTSAEDDGTQDDGESLETINQRLMARIEELSARVTGAQPVQDEQEEEIVPPTVVEETKDLLQKFVGDDVDLDALLEDRNALNSVLSAVHKAAVREATEEATKRMLLSLPKVMTSYLTRHSTTKDIVDGFYTQNEDLKNVKATVKAVAIDLQRDNPDWNVAKLLQESATKTREMLGLRRKATQTKETKANGPAFASSGKGQRPVVQKKSKLQTQIEDLIRD